MTNEEKKYTVELSESQIDLLLITLSYEKERLKLQQKEVSDHDALHEAFVLTMGRTESLRNRIAKIRFYTPVTIDR